MKVRLSSVINFWVCQLCSTGNSRRLRRLPQSRCEQLEVRLLATVPRDAFEEDNSASTAKTVLTNGALQQRTIHTASDVDWARFKISEESLVTIETSGVSGDTVLELYAPNATDQISSDDDGGVNRFSQIERRLSAGTYFARVTEYRQDSSIDAYSLRVTSKPLGQLSDRYESDNTSATSRTIGLSNIAQTRSLHRPTDVDWLTFQITQASRVTVNLSTADTRHGSPEMSLYANASKTTLASSSYQMVRTLTPGRYRIAVTEAGADGIVPQYTISATAVILPDLTISAARIGGTTKVPIGSQVTVNWTGKNMGPGTMGATYRTDAIYFSTNTTFGGCDPAIAHGDL